MLTSGPVDWLSQEGFLTWLKVRSLPVCRRRTAWEVPCADIKNRYILTTVGRARSAIDTNQGTTSPSCEKSFWPRQEPQSLASMAPRYVTPTPLGLFHDGNEGLLPV
jgi:hypothetical protein